VIALRPTLLLEPCFTNYKGQHSILHDTVLIGQCDLKLLKDRQVQVWIVAEGWKWSQACRFLTSWPRSYSV